MDTEVSCGQCDTPLAEPPGLPFEERTACPVCGSKTRAFHVFAENTINLTQELKDAVVEALPDIAATSGLALGAVVDLGEKTNEGRIISAVTPAWFAIIREILKNPEYMHQIDARRWEELIAGAYEREGYKVTLTPRSGDYGRDVIAVREGFGSVRILDQVKAFSPGHLVTANDVRAMLGVITGDHNTSKGVVTTTSDFAPRIEQDPLLVPFMPYRLELVNGLQLVRRFAEIEAKPRRS